MLKVIANKNGGRFSLKSLWGGYRTARRLARLVEGQDRTIVFRPERVVASIPASRRLMEAIRERNGKKILVEPNSTTWEIFNGLYRFARRGTGFIDRTEHEISHINDALANVAGARDPDLEYYIGELVKIRSRFGNGSSIPLLANAVIDFRGDFREEDRMVGLKIQDEVRLTAGWLKGFRAIFSHPQTRRAFKEFIKDYHYGFTFPSRLASLTAVIGNMALDRTAFNREILEQAHGFQCDTIRFDPHFGTILEEMELRIPFEPRDPKKLRILDIGCGTSAIGSVTLKYMVDTLNDVFGGKISVEATGIDINYPSYGLYPRFNEKGRTIDKAQVYDFDQNGQAEVSGIRYLDAGLPKYNVTQNQFCLGEEFDIIICSMLLLDVPADRKEIMLENLRRMIPPGGVLFLNATSKEDVRSWESFEIWYRSKETSKVGILDQVIPFEEDPYTHKFQVDFIAEGEALLSRRQYVKRKNNLLNDQKRIISHGIELAKKHQKRGSSVWGRIMAAQKLASQGGAILDVFMEIVKEIDNPQFKKTIEEFLHLGKNMHVYDRYSFGFEKAPGVDDIYNFLLWKYLESGTSGDNPDEKIRLYMPISNLPVAHEAASTSYFPNVFARALRLRNCNSSGIEEYFSSKGGKEQKLERIVKEYLGAWGGIKALASMFTSGSEQSVAFLDKLIKMLIRFPVFPDFRDERFEILRLFIFSRYMDFFQDRIEPTASDIREIACVLVPLAEYLGNSNLAEAFKKLYSGKTRKACVPVKIDPLIYEELLMVEYVFYKEETKGSRSSWEIKELPKGTRFKDLSGIFGNGYSYEAYGLAWDFERGRARSVPLRLDEDDRLKTGMAVILKRSK